MCYTLKKNAIFYKILVLLVLSSFLYAKDIRVSYDPDYAPFSYSVDGEAYGLFIDIWQLWAKKNHHHISFIQGKNWDDALKLCKTKKVDFFLGTTSYKKWMKGSKAYYKTKTALYLLKNFDKKMHTIGIVGEDYRENLIKKLPHTSIISYETYTQLLKALLTHKVDAIYDDTIAISYYAIKNKYNHLIKHSNILAEISAIQAISATKQNIHLFNVGFTNLTHKELEKIEVEWILDKDMRFYNNANFLKKKEFSYVFDPDWKPFEYKDEMSNVHMGIIADILSLISSKSKLSFKPVATDTWAESVKLIKEHKVDMMSAVPWTKDRDKYLNFTKKSIYSYPAVLVTNKNKKFTINEKFENITIGVVKDNSLGEWVKHKYPNANFVYFDTVKNGFEALEDNEVDFFGINGVSATYYINVLGFNDAKVYTILDYMFYLKVALLKSVEPEALALIDEALSSITQKEFSDIYHKWTSITVKKEVKWELILWIVSISLGIVFIFIFINKRLNKLVIKKTKQLRELNENLESKVEQRTKELAQINKKMQDNIQYASLIQNSILPHNKQLSDFFKEHIVIWEPKDIVGGDIYFFQQIDKDEALVLVIDCTGHGVSGAFVTMLVKAIEEQLLSTLPKDLQTPSNILKSFNHSFKKLLFQTYTNSNVGFDAGVIHINKKTNILSFAGANIALNYMYESKLNTLKANRYSVGYVNSKDEYHYVQHQLTLKKGMTFYITTDGYLDQNGGKKSFPFGKRRFFELLEKYHKRTLDEQKDIFLNTLKEYQNTQERNDDITLIGFRVL
ncbi:MAG: transporter substrate-binding domain-containing protein [Epsilonproteobacteria bacterium]|nr:transporter substrate-binding domain-containing protein [Campylobacterota bacterium]